MLPTSIGIYVDSTKSESRFGSEFVDVFLLKVMFRRMWLFQRTTSFCLSVFGALHFTERGFHSVNNLGGI